MHAVGLILTLRAEFFVLILFLGSGHLEVPCHGNLVHDGNEDPLIGTEADLGFEDPMCFLTFGIIHGEDKNSWVIGIIDHDMAMDDRGIGISDVLEPDHFRFGL